jgi:hypothetical protein
MAEYKQYSSISGCDIHASFGNYKFGELQMIRYSISREKGHIYTMNSANAKATARGKRSVGGACVFTMLEKEGLVKAMSQANSAYDNSIFLSHDEKATYANYGNQFVSEIGKDHASALRAGGSLSQSGLIGGNTFSPFVSRNIFTEDNFGSSSQAYLADQLLPFDITIVGIPEYGYSLAKRMIIHGVEFMSEASGSSIDDLVIEKQMSFIATSVSDWVAVDQLGLTGTKSVNV